MIQITLSEEIICACPDLHILAISGKVENTVTDEALWQEIELLTEEIRATSRIEDINKWPPIQATRQAYKRLGKDPNRYRPSAEALRRRILRGLPLYKIDTLVDIINLVSIRSGYSIGGFDASRIDGDLTLGVGKAREPYQAIGRGELNIEGLPVYRDRQGGVGTPTSDEERTKIGLQTNHLLMIINGYSGADGLVETGKYAHSLLRKHASFTQYEAELIIPGKRENIILG